MTKDGHFKREVRRVARESGEPYTAVRARRVPGRPRQADRDEPRWVVAYTFPGLEDWLCDWLASNYGSMLERVLVPRYRGDPVVPGMLVLEIGEGADVFELLQLPHLTDYVGSPAEARRLTWEDVRQVLRKQGTWVRRRASTGAVRPGAPALSADVPVRFPRVPKGSGSEEREAQELLATLSDGLTEREREEAKTALLLALDPVVEHTVIRFSASSRFPHAELLEAGYQGLFRAVDSFERARALAPPPGCRRVDFRSYATWCIGESVARRLAALEREEVNTALVLAHGGLVEEVIMRYRASSGLSHAELLEAGQEGLSRAAGSFDRSRGVDFRNYATWYIRQAISRRLSEPG